MTTIPSAAPLPPAPSMTSAAPRAHRPIPLWWRDLTGAIFWGVILGVVALWILGGEIQTLTSVSGVLNSTGRLTGLIASALLLLQVFLMARIPWVEQAWGQDQIARTHRIVGFSSFTLLMAHIVLIWVGYAAASPTGLWRTLVDLVLHYPGMLLAVAGTLALIMVVLTSVKKARAKLRYESWHLLHLYAYLGAGLALPHQLWTGADFTRSTLATMFWWGLYAAALVSVLVWRLGLPIWRSWRADLRVVEVRTDSPTQTTVTVAGPGVASVSGRAGQFYQWRFLSGPGWSRANPYSLSAAPDGRSLRLTAAHLGDGSASLANLRVGTRVALEGPYGRLHEGVRRRSKVLLMASGIGITPMRALLEDLPAQPGDITVLHRVRSGADVPLSHEVSALAAERGMRYLLIEGPRIPGRDTWLPLAASHLTDEEALRQVVPDVADHDIFLCGAPAWMDAAANAARAAGVPAEHIHLERFAY